MKIVITGGHVSPALAIIDLLQKQYPDVSLVFVGRKYMLEGEKTLSLEYKEVVKRNIRFIPLTAGRLTRLVAILTIKSLLKVPVGFFQALKIIQQEKPDIILSFGGYLALPVAFSGFISGTPVFTHEQTIHPGIANRLIALISRKVFVAFEEAKKYFSPLKTVVTGNPIREKIFTYKKRSLSIGKNRPVIYATGGSLGSHSVNILIFKLLPKLLQKYIIIHQTGETKKYKDYEKACQLAKKLPPAARKNYHPRQFIFDDEIGYIYSLADLVVGRSGANTFFELIALKKPTVFIPLPWSGSGEQEEHAAIFKQFGAGEIFHQGESEKKLLKLIDKMIKNREEYKKNFSQLSYLYKTNATQLIVSAILAKK